MTAHYHHVLNSEDRDDAVKLRRHFDEDRAGQQGGFFTKQRGGVHRCGIDCIRSRVIPTDTSVLPIDAHINVTVKISKRLYEFTEVRGSIAGPSASVKLLLNHIESLAGVELHPGWLFSIAAYRSRCFFRRKLPDAYLYVVIDGMVDVSNLPQRRFIHLTKLDQETTAQMRRKLNEITAEENQKSRQNSHPRAWSATTPMFHDEVVEARVVVPNIDKTFILSDKMDVQKLETPPVSMPQLSLPVLARLPIRWVIHSKSWVRDSQQQQRLLNLVSDESRTYLYLHRSTWNLNDDKIRRVDPSLDLRTCLSEWGVDILSSDSTTLALLATRS